MTIAFYLVVGLLLAEGALCALFPDVVKRLIEESPPQVLRIAGAIEIAFAVAVAAVGRL